MEISLTGSAAAPGLRATAMSACTGPSQDCAPGPAAGAAQFVGAGSGRRSSQHQFGGKL